MDFYSENNPFCASCNDALPDYYLKGSDLRTIVIGFQKDVKYFGNKILTTTPSYENCLEFFDLVTNPTFIASFGDKPACIIQTEDALKKLVVILGLNA